MSVREKICLKSTSYLCFFCSMLQKQEVGQAVLERYLALEDEIAQAEQDSPKIALDQKKGQVETLRAKITEQQVLVEKLEEST